MNRRVLSYIVMGLTALIWISGFSKITALSDVMGYSTIIFFRFLIAALIMGVFNSGINNKEKIKLGDRKRTVLSGFLCSALYFSLLKLSGNYLPVVDSAALSSMQLIFMLWGESVVLGKIVTPRKTLFIVLATIGGILLMRPVTLSIDSIMAYLIALVATAVWVVYCIVQLPLLKKYRLTTVMGNQFFWGCLMMFPFAAYESNTLELMTGDHWSSLLYLAVLGLTFGYTANAYALKHIGPTNTSLLLIIQPILILFSDSYYHHHSLVFWDYIGLVFIGVGMFYVTKKMPEEGTIYPDNLRDGEVVTDV